MLTEQVQKALAQVENGKPEEGLKKLKKLLSSTDMTDELRFETAQYLHALGYLDEAVNIYRQLVEAYPEEDQLKLALAEAWSDRGQEEEALELLRQISSGSDQYLAGVLLSADILLQQGLHEVALHKVRKALEQHPEEKVLYQALGEIYFDQGEYSLALLNFNKGGQAPVKKLAECLAHLGRFEEALAKYQEALQEERDPQLLLGAGVVSFQMGAWAEAIGYFEKLIDHDPYFTSAYLYLVQAYYKINRLEDALDKADKGLRYDETNANLFYWRGFLLERKKETEEAKLSYLQAVELDPELSEAWEALLHLSIEQNQVDDALHYIKRLLEFSPDRADLWLKQGELLEELEEWDKAEQSYRKVLNLAPDHVEGLNRLADLLYAEGKRDEAISLWKKSLKINGDQWEIEERLERALEEDDRW